MNRYFLNWYLGLLSLMSIQTYPMAQNWWGDLRDTASQKFQDISGRAQEFAKDKTLALAQRMYAQDAPNTVREGEISQQSQGLFRQAQEKRLKFLQQAHKPYISQDPEDLENAQIQMYKEYNPLRVRQVIIEGLKNEQAKHELIDTYNQNKKAKFAEHVSRSLDILKPYAADSFLYNLAQENTYLPEKEEALRDLERRTAIQKNILDREYNKSYEQAKQNFEQNKSNIIAQRNAALKEGLLPAVSAGAGFTAGLYQLAKSMSPRSISPINPGVAATGGFLLPAAWYRGSEGITDRDNPYHNYARQQGYGFV